MILGELRLRRESQVAEDHGRSPHRGRLAFSQDAPRANRVNIWRCGCVSGIHLGASSEWTAADASRHNKTRNHQVISVRADVKILFVCLGNICRSPTAEAVLRTLVAREAPELRIEVDSAGTAAYHVGSAPDPRTRAAGARRGYDLERLRARVIESSDFERFDLILAMDEENLRVLRRRAPAPTHERLRLFLEFHPQPDVREVPDPYYGGPNGFEEVLDLTEAAARGLLAHLRQLLRAA
jgi:protein-tyrosine phosphatase